MTNLSHVRISAGSSRMCGAHVLSRPLVLVVEDHDDTRYLLRTLLEMRGCRVVEAEDGEAAIRQAEILRPDLILMDRSLPRLDGISVLRHIRGQAEMRHMPVIFLSGHAHPTDSQAAFDAGCDDYLVKPLDFKEWERVITQHLGQFKLDGEEVPVRGISE